MVKNVRQKKTNTKQTYLKILNLKQILTTTQVLIISVAAFFICTSLSIMYLCWRDITSDLVLSLFADLRMHKIKIVLILFHSAATTVRPQPQDHQPLLPAWHHHTCLSTLVCQLFRVPQNILEIGASRYHLALLLSQPPSLPPGPTLMCARSYMLIWQVSVQSSLRQPRHHPQELTWEQLLCSKDQPTCTTL